MRTHPTAPIPSFPTESAALSAPMDPLDQSRSRKEILAPLETRVTQVCLAMMESPDSLASLVHLAPLAPLALAETSLLK